VPRALLLLVIFVLCAPAARAQAEWQFLGPQPLTTPHGARGGAIFTLAAAPGGVLYAGGRGSLWRSNDSGASWSALPSGFGSRNALALHVTSGGRLWVGLDGAEGAATDGLWASGDGGATLSPRAFPGLDVVQIVSAADGTLLVCATGPGQSATPPGLYTLHDGGASWTQLLTGNVNSVVTVSGAWLATRSGHVLRSTDGGATFTELAVGAAGATEVVVAAAPDDVFALFVGVGDAPVALLHSADAGQTWTPTRLPSLTGSAADGVAAWPPGRRLLAADPTRRGQLWLGGADLWFSPDAGASWVNRTATAVSTAVSPRQHALVWDGSGGFWLGSDGGVWRSLDGVTFQNQNATLGNLSVDALAVPAPSGAQPAIFAALDGQGIALPGNDAASWTLAAASGGGSLLALPSGVVVAADPFAAAIRRSDDGGVSFQTVTGSNSPAADQSHSNTLVPLAADGSGVLYCGTWRIWRSQDAGRTWAPQPGSEVSGTITALAIAPGSAAVVWEGGSAGQLLRSDDGGASWRDVSGPWKPGAALDAILPGAAGRVWVALDGIVGAQIWTSSDGGVSWSTSTTTLPRVRQLLGEPLDAAVIYASSDAGVIASPDSGRHWMPLGSMLQHATATALLLLSGSRRLLAGSVGEGVWSFQLNAASALAQALHGAGQSAPVGTPLPQPLVVHVGNVFGADASGVAVAWHDGGADGSFSSATTTTAPDGTAASSYTLPQHAGPITVTASVAANPTASVATFSVTALTAAASQLAPIGGSNQTQTVGTRLSDPLRVEVTDARGNGVAGVAVSFDDGKAGGRFDTASVTTDSNGVAGDGYVLPAQSGPITISASAAHLPVVTFAETATPLPDFSIALVPATLSLNQGAATTFSITTAAVGGSTQPITLLCQQPATGCTATPARLVLGATATLSLAAGALPVGNSLVLVTASDGTHTHTASATVTVVARDYTLSATPTAQSGAAGSKLAYVLNLTSSGGLSGALALACGALPATVSCTFSNAAPTLDGVNPLSSTLTVSTMASSTGTLAASSRPSGPWSNLAAWWAVLLMACAMSRAPRRVLLLAGAALLLQACGGGGIAAPAPHIIPGTPAGNYTITVNATGAGLPTHSVAVTLTVQ